MLVQTREFDVRLISEPAGMEPSARSEPDGPRVTVLPLAVVVGVVGRGVVRAGVRVVVPEVLGGVLVGALAAGADVVGRSGCGHVLERRLSGRVLIRHLQITIERCVLRECVAASFPSTRRPREQLSVRAELRCERYILTSGSASVEDACPRLPSHKS